MSLSPLPDPFHAPAVTIVGNGAVGSVLKKFSNYSVERNNFDSWLSLPTPSGLVVLAVPDTVLGSVVHAMKDQWLGFKEGGVVIHVSGSQPLELLNSLRGSRCAVGVAHPFQTFRGNDHVNVLDGVAWGVECDEEAWTTVQWFVDRTGGHAYRLPSLSSEERLQYHASAVAASNFVYAGLSLATALANTIGIPAGHFIRPILLQTIHNAMQALETPAGGYEFPVTGPLARGDFRTVEDQYFAIPTHLRAQYALHSLALLEQLGHRHSPADVSRLRTLFLAEVQKEWERTSHAKHKGQ